jgi:hypothetical protein
MANQSVVLREELVEKLLTMARGEGQSLDDVVERLIAEHEQTALPRVSPHTGRWRWPRLPKPPTSTGWTFPIYLRGIRI